MAFILKGIHECFSFLDKKEPNRMERRHLNLIETPNILLTLALRINIDLHFFFLIKEIELRDS